MIIYGAQYYRPPFPEKECWKGDLLKMKQSNFNTVKLWAVWSWIERKEGEYYFDDLDALVDACAEVGLNVVINTIPEGMPYWAARRHPDARYTTHEGQRIEMSGAANMPSGGSPGLCADKPEVQAQVCGFIRKVVERYAPKANVIAFDVWNEPHIEPIFDYPDKLFCYCEHSQARFTAWLQAKYGTIEALNERWLRAYAGWEDVLPPARFGTYPDMMDWRRFWVENLGAWLEARVAAARPAANGKILMTHVPFSGYIGGSGEGGLGQHLGDEFILAEKVDQFGLTSFPKWLMGNDYVQHLANLELVAAAAASRASGAASASRASGAAAAGKDFWQSELQAGVGKWEAFGRPVASPEEIRLWNWSAAACGAKGVLFWQWRPEPSGTEAPGFGLTTLDGELSPRTETAAACAAAFNAANGFDRARLLLPANGIFVSRNAALWWHAAGRGEALYARGLYGAYRACFDAGIPVRMVHADRLGAALDDGLDALHVLYAPAPLALSDGELSVLERFVSGGGTLVVEACPGLFDERGVIGKDRRFMEEVFGLGRPEIDSLGRVAVRWLEGEGLEFSGRYYRQDFQALRPGVRRLGVFEDGRPAVTERDFGGGRAVWVGTFPSLAVSLDQDAGSAGFICRWMRPAGYPQLRELAAGEKTLVRLHQNGNNIYVSAVNYGERDQHVRLQFGQPCRLAHNPSAASLDEDGRRLDFDIDGGNGVIIGLEQA